MRHVGGPLRRWRAMRSAISSSDAVAVATYSTGSPLRRASRSAKRALARACAARARSTLRTQSATGEDRRASARRHDRLQIGDRLFESIALIDDHVVVLAHALHLALGGCESNLALLGGLGAARRQPRHELVERRRAQKDGDRVGQFPAHGAGALDVRRQDHVVPAPQPVADALQRDTVAIQVVHHRVLQELARRRAARRTPGRTGSSSGSRALHPARLGRVVAVTQ